MGKPLVSVIIPTYNKAGHIKKSIESALSQTYKNLEIFIIDGSLNNETEKILRPYLKDPRIKYIREPEIHIGIVKEDRKNIKKARNKGIRAAQGKYIAFLDDDDLWCSKTKIEKQVEFLEKNPAYVICGSGVLVRDERNPKTPTTFKYLYPEKDENIRKMMLFEPPFLHSCVVFRKNAYEKVGEIDKEFDILDWELWYKLGMVGKMYNFQDYFVQYSMISKEKLARLLIKSQLKLINKYRHDYPYFYKACLLTQLRYYYSFLPFSIRQFISPLISRARKIIFGPGANRYIKKF